MQLYLLGLFLFFNFYVFPGSNWSDMSNAMEVDEQTEHQEPFPFAQLPLDMQKEIASYMWVAQDSDDDFKKRLLEFDPNPSNELQETSIAERKLYGLHGRKTPIYFHTYRNNKPDIREVGCILQNEERFSLGHNRLADGYISAYHLFLTISNHTIKYHRRIKSKHDASHIRACSLSVLGDLAIVWEDNPFSMQSKKYLTLLTVEQLRECREIDLDQNKISLNNTEVDDFWLKLSAQINNVESILFNLKGSKIGIAWYEALPYFESATFNNIVSPSSRLQFIDAPSKNKELAPNQIMKRLMISQKLFGESLNNNVRL